MMRRVEAVGWGFFLILALILVGPLVFLFWQMVDVEENPMAPFGLGALSAMLSAGLLAWLANTTLQWFRGWRQAKARRGGNIQPTAKAQSSKSSKAAKRSKRGKRRKQKAK